MILVAFADVHANLPALEAVLAAVDQLAPDLLLCAGDLVGYGPHPDPVVDLVRQRAIPTVRGDHDDAVASSRTVEGPGDVSFPQRLLYKRSVEWTRDHMTHENRQFLGALPHSLTTSVRGRALLLVHGSPRRLDQTLGDASAGASLRRVFQQHSAHILVVGHSHQPCHRVLDGRHLINPGAVGRPHPDGGGASLAIIEVDNSVTVKFMRVPYDRRGVARDLAGSGLPPELAREMSSAPN